MVDADHTLTIRSAETAIEKLRPWRRGEVQAPHKPLLLLLALRHVADGKPRLMAFPDIEPELRDLIGLFIKVKSPPNAGYPFWRLQADGLWEIEGANSFSARTGNTDPPLRELRSRPARGGFPSPLHVALRTDPDALARLRLLVASRFFDPGDQILRTAGLHPYP